MSNKILSIIVPSYNISNFIDECVPKYIDKSLFEDIDIYFIDDGATDDTAKKLSEYIKKYPSFFHFYHKENGGHGSVINYGITNCVETKYFKVIDGDDFVDFSALHNLAEYLKTCDDDLIVSGFSEKYPNKETKRTPLLIDNGSFIEKKTYDSKILPSLNVTIHSCTFKSSIFKNNKIVLPEKTFYEDNLYILYTIPFLQSISFLNEYVYYYRLGNPNQSVSKISRAKHFNDSLNVRKLAISYFDKYIYGKNVDKELFAARKYARGMSCYRSAIIVNDDLKASKIQCLQFLKEDKKYKSILAELKKSKLLRFLFFTRFSFLGLVRKHLLK